MHLTDFFCFSIRVGVKRSFEDEFAESEKMMKMDEGDGEDEEEK